MAIRVLVRSNRNRRNLSLYFVDPLTGKEVSRSAGTPDPNEAQRAAAKWEAELLEHRGVANGGWDWFRQRFNDERLPQLRTKTRKCYNTALARFEGLMNPRDLSEITSSLLSRFQAELQKQGAQLTTVASYMRHISSALNWAERQGMLAKSPKFEPVKINRRRMMRGRPLTETEYLKMRSACSVLFGKEAGQFARLLELLWFSGLRLSEARLLSWDSPPIQLMIESKPYPQIVIYGEAQKSGQDELLPIAPDMAAWLEQTPATQRTGLVAPISHVAGENRAGKPYHKVGQAISALGEHCGIVVNSQTGKFASAHDFRRAFGQRWAKKLKPLTLQKLMRHADLTTTLRYYVGLSSEDAAAELWLSNVPANVPNAAEISKPAE